MNTGYPPDNFGTTEKICEQQIKALKAKIKRLECCGAKVTEGAPTTDGTILGEVRIDPTAGIIYYWDGDSWEPYHFNAGIAYQDIPHFQTTVFRTGDEGYRVSNGLMDQNNPLFPIYTQQLDEASADPFNTLLYNNVFGNTTRFTDINGLQVYGDEIVVDHLTKRMYSQLASGTFIWDAAVDNGEAAVVGGFTDWYTITYPEATTLYQYLTGATIFAGVSFAGHFWTSTTISNATTRAMRYIPGTGAGQPTFAQTTKATGVGGAIILISRVFDESELNI